MTKKEDKQLFNQHTFDDHNTLISLVSSFNDFKQNVNEKFADIKADIKELREGIASRVEILEKEKADRKELDGVQAKINSIQKHLNENVESRLKAGEDWRIQRMEQVREETNKSALYFKVVVFMGFVLFSLLLWHITGFKL